MLEVSNLTKEFKVQLRSEGRFAAAKDFFSPQYQTKLAVNDISFQIDDGEIVAYIGPNGSGKSTTIKMLSGILTPTSGEVRVNGIIPYENRKKIKDVLTLKENVSIPSKILLVDDVITSGQTILSAYRFIEKKAETIKILVLCDNTQSVELCDGKKFPIPWIADILKKK